jgi:RNA polymerase sigma factor (sigma-70 family)
LASTLAARFEKVVLPHLDAVYRMARRLARSESEAEDLVQETFVRALRAFDQFELRAFGAKPWLFKILHNVFYTRAGRARRQPTLLDDVDFDHFAAELDEAQTDESTAGTLDWERCDQPARVSQRVAALGGGGEELPGDRRDLPLCRGDGDESVVPSETASGNEAQIVRCRA